MTPPKTEQELLRFALKLLENVEQRELQTTEGHTGLFWVLGEDVDHYDIATFQMAVTALRGKT